jgi:hypothetical protein
MLMKPHTSLTNPEPADPQVRELAALLLDWAADYVRSRDVPGGQPNSMSSMTAARAGESER